MIFAYEDGKRTPFDPDRMRFKGCLLCGRPATDIGIFVPTSTTAEAMVMRLRQHVPPGAIAYGLCRRCGEHPDMFTRVERELEAAAAKVVLQ